MKVHFATAYATGGSINAVDTVDAGSATVVWDEPGVIFLKLLAIAAEIRKGSHNAREA